MAIPPAVATRWNSISMTLQANVRLKTVLNSIREARPINDPNLTDLQRKVPSEEHMKIYELLLPLLLAVREESEKLSAEKVSTISQVIPSIYQLRMTVEEVIINE